MYYLTGMHAVTLKFTCTVHACKSLSLFFSLSPSSLRTPEPFLWKLDRTENFSRMRLRLSRCYNLSSHSEASQLRDSGLASSTSKESEPSTSDTALLSLAKATR